MLLRHAVTATVGSMHVCPAQAVGFLEGTHDRGRNVPITFVRQACKGGCVIGMHRKDLLLSAMTCQFFQKHIAGMFPAALCCLCLCSCRQQAGPLTCAGTLKVQCTFRCCSRPD